ncbi:MAG: hypothetical protein H6577_04420 [Lewinellaceae bacterium]|nr:hypothetical protein [Lewinellaceae bacterium]
MNKDLQPSEETIAQTDIGTLARQFILNLFNQKNDARLVFHTYRQTLEIARTVNTLAQANGLTEQEWEAAELASWFVNVGYLFDYQNPMGRSLELAEKFFAAHHFQKEKQAPILAVLKAVFSDQPLKLTAAQVLSDAIRAAQFGERFLENVPLLRLERELLLNQQFSNEEWGQYQIQLLLSARFFTSHAKVAFEPLVANHLVALKEKLDRKKNRAAEGGEAKKFKHLQQKTSTGTQTFFRTNYRTHINLSAIADNKANIMISVNAILISVVISIISYRNMTETIPGVLAPTLIFLVTGLASLIFAVLAARPKVTSIVNDSTPIEDAKKNIVFFGNFVNLKMEKYEELMDEVFNDSELLYGNLTRDLYHLGKVLDKKYRFLSLSYNVFMVGFIATVMTFLIVLLT